MYRMYFFVHGFKWFVNYNLHVIKGCGGRDSCTRIDNWYQTSVANVSSVSNDTFVFVS